MPNGQNNVLEEPQLGRHERVHYVRRQVLPDEQQGLDLFKKLGANSVPSGEVEDVSQISITV